MALAWAKLSTQFDNPIGASNPLYVRESPTFGWDQIDDTVTDYFKFTLSNNIAEATPTTANTAHPVILSPTAAARVRALMQFDVSSLSSRKVQKAYLRLVNRNVANDATVKITVARLLRAWTDAATWNTYDGTNAWGTAGALNTSTDIVDKIVSQTVFRITGFDSVWFIDVTELVRGWVDGTLTNNGLLLYSDVYIELMRNTWATGVEPTLVVSHTADDKGTGKIYHRNKLRNAAYTLQNMHNAGGWTWTNGGIRNAQALADKTGHGYKNLLSLKTYFDHYITAAGGWQNGAAGTSYYETTMGEALIYLYEATGLAQYKTAIDALRTMFNTLTKSNRVFVESGQIITELYYCACDFLAAYGDKYGDAAATDMALSQANILFDLLLEGQRDGVPLHKYGNQSSKGWLRGLGWQLGGMGKMLRYKTIQQHPKFPQFLKNYRKLVKTTCELQMPSGMWRSLVHDPTYPPEASGTAMIALGIEYGVHTGYLDTDYYGVVDKARSGLSKCSRTGVDLGKSFPSNSNADYTIKQFAPSSEFGFGFWMELEHAIELRETVMEMG